MQQKEYTAQQKEMNRVHGAIYHIMLQNMGEGIALQDVAESNTEQKSIDGAALQNSAGESVSEKGDMLTERLTFYINTCKVGIFDVKDTLEADNMEFLQMAYYSMLGALPEQAILARWQEKADKSAWEFRKEVMEALTAMPEIAVKNIIVRNNIYTETQTTKGKKQSLKQRILFGGYQLSRKLPNSIKVPLKKIAMKILMK